jgi:hypothetical protein
VPLELALEGFMSKIASFPLAALAAVSFTLTACEGDKNSGSSTPTTSAPSSTAPTTSAPPSTPTATPASSAPVKRTDAELTKALVALSDLPSGFAVEPNDPSGDGGAFSSKNTKCRTLVNYLNADEAPGSKATAARSFSGGEEGPYIDFGLDGVGSSKAVTALQQTFRTAVNTCKTVTLRISGLGTSPMGVREISAPRFGEHPFAFRLTGTSGPLQGLEFTAATTGLNDVVLSVGVLAGQPGALDGATEAAVTKARKVLRGTKSGA